MSKSLDAAILAAPEVRARRSPRWIVLGVLLTCLGILGAWFLYAQLSQSHSVVVVASTLHRGAEVTRADLATVTIGSTPGVETVAAADLEQLIGQRAVLDVTAGSLLPPSAVGEQVVPAAGHSVVGLRLPEGRAPAGHLVPGGQVRLVEVPAGAGATTPEDADYVVDGVVVDSSPGADGLSLQVNVEVESDQAASVARLAAQERVVVIKEAEG
ncbi:MAG: SAF domain-containing protein [Propionibacteriaceae bacterium]